MTTLLFLFILALGFSLALTPLVKKPGIRLGAVDHPSERKVHTTPIPRIGGLAVFLSFTATMALTNLFVTHVSDLFIFNLKTAFGFYGALVVFGCGLWDDFRRLSPWIKFPFQIAGATLAFAGGISIGGFFVGDYGIQFGILSYIVTVFWFLLFINAVNLIDGLDGLASGVVFFTCIVMFILSVMKEDYLSAMYFAALGGSVLGFLRYNFNPASIFLGDGGSYFLGYAVAALSIMGSVKSQVGAVILIPLLAMGVPIFDTMLAPIRRFIRGRKMFSPDNGHVHHRLISMGLTTRSAVLFIYLITLGLCILALMLVNVRDERAGLFLIVLGAGAVIFIRKLGYFEYFATDKIYGWFKDLTDEAGLSHERRTFLSIQIDIGRSGNMAEIWNHVSQSLRLLDFDFASLYLNNSANNKPGALFEGRINGDSAERRKTPVSMSSVSMRDSPPDWVCSLEPDKDTAELCSRCQFRLEMQLLGKDDANYGTLLLLKDLKRSSMENFTLKRVESLRRSVISALEKLEREGAR